MIWQKILSNQLVRYALVLLLGAGLGAVFYPTSKVEEKMHNKYEEEVKTIKEAHLSEVASIKEQQTSTSQEYKQYKQETEKKVQTLTTQVQNLQSKRKTSFYKLVKPDGTIEIKQYSESEVKESSSTITSIQEEFKTKVESIEQKWEQVHKQRISSIKKEFTEKEEVYKKKIEELEKSKIISKNEKSFGVEGGYSSDNRYYLHGSGDLFGPIFIGIHSESNKQMDDKSVGAGLGVRF